MSQGRWRRFLSAAVALAIGGSPLAGCGEDTRANVETPQSASPTSPEELLDTYAQAVRDRSEADYRALFTEDASVVRDAGSRVCMPWLSDAYWAGPYDPDLPCAHYTNPLCWMCEFDLDPLVLDIQERTGGSMVLARFTTVYYYQDSGYVAETRFDLDIVETSEGLHIASMQELPPPLGGDAQ
jgi:hypothetical protein